MTGRWRSHLHPSIAKMAPQKRILSLINQAFRLRGINPAGDQRGCSPHLDTPFDGARSKLRGILDLIEKPHFHRPLDQHCGFGHSERPGIDIDTQIIIQYERSPPSVF